MFEECNHFILHRIH